MFNKRVVLIFGLALTFLCSGALSASAMTCTRKGVLRFPSANGSYHDEAAAYCYRKDPRLLFSLNCRKSSCDALRPHAVQTSDLHEVLGTPGARLCHRNGGKAEIVFFKADGAFIKINRCFFGRDGSFLDLSSYWRTQVKPAELFPPAK